MKTLEEQIAELAAEYENKKAALTRECEAESKLPDYAAGYYRFVHFHQLYGSEVHFDFQHCRYESIRGKLAQPDVELARRLWRDVVPRQRCMVRDGCVSFPPAEYVAANPKKYESPRAQIVPVCPLVVRIDTSDSLAEFQWHGVLSGVNVEIGVKVPVWNLNLGGVELRRKQEYYGRPGPVEFCEYRPSELVKSMPGYGRIKWGTGSNEHPGDFTVYWTDPTVSVNEFLNAIEKPRAVTT